MRELLLQEDKMKKILVAGVLVLFSVSIACAEWLVDFRETYASQGIDKAVENAMKEGKTPVLIVENGLELEGLNPQNLIKALYCSGAKGQDIREAAQKYEISEMLVAAGFQQSKVECSDMVADTQAYTPVGGGLNFTSPRRGRTGLFNVSPANP